MPERLDIPLNGVYNPPWTLDLSTVGAIALPPSGILQATELPLNAYDCRFVRGFTIEVEIGTITGSPVLQLAWSNSGKGYIPFASTYQLTLANGTVNGWIITDFPAFQWLQVQTVTAGTGTASLYFNKRT